MEVQDGALEEKAEQAVNHVGRPRKRQVTGVTGVSGVSAMQRVVLHFNPVEEHASLKESQRAEEEMRNGDLAIHHPVQSMEVGLTGVTGQAVR